jgi:hypothetical protein
LTWANAVQSFLRLVAASNRKSPFLAFRRRTLSHADRTRMITSLEDR